jgi:hypothetical protein
MGGDAFVLLLAGADHASGGRGRGNRARMSLIMQRADP